MAAGATTATHNPAHRTTAEKPAARPAARPAVPQLQQAAGNQQAQRLHTAARGAPPPPRFQAVQAKCAACAAEETQQAKPPVQMWSCGEYSEPTCVQTSPDGASPADAEIGAEPGDSDEPVQTQCAACDTEGAEDAAVKVQANANPEPVQAQCATCAAAGNPSVSAAKAEEQTERPVQMWSCGEYTEPTCVQTQRDDAQSELADNAAEPEADGANEAVQAKCAACAAEEAEQARRPVQRDDAREAHSPAMIHRTAKLGLSEANQPLPHGEHIQVAFGRHDISHIRAGVGGAAESANRRMGAQAFASGERIAFHHWPDLHLAAHEAAHVVQQREGLSLPNQVGRPGDRWERHADQVADAVAGGRSAESLLDQVAKPKATSPPAEPPLQGRFTADPTRQIEPPPVLPAPPRSPAESKGQAAGGAGAADRGAGKPAMERAKEGDDGPPPQGVTVGGSGGGPASGAAGGAGQPTPPGAPEAPSGGGLNAPCYNVDPPPRPKDAPDPKSDQRSGDAKEEPKVTFDAWVDEVDHCPPEAQLAQASQQGPGGGGATGPAGAAPAAAPQAVSQTAGEAPGASPNAGGSGGAAGAASGGAGEGGAAETGGGELESTISKAAGDRDRTVSDYEAANGALDGVLNRARGMEAGVGFAPGGGDAEREAASEEVRGFMRRAAGQIVGAVVFARVSAPNRLGRGGETAMSAVQGAIESEKNNISARILNARSQAHGLAQAARAHVHAQYALGLALIIAETATAIAALKTEHKAARDQIDRKETKGLGDVNAAFATGRKQHEDKGPEYAKKAVDRGQEHAHKYERCKIHPKTGVNYDDDGFWDGCLTVRRAKAQQDTACKTAAGYKTTFLRTANQKGYDLKELRKLYRCAVISGAGEVQKTLDDTHDKLVQGLEKGQKEAIAALGVARAQNLHAINLALNGRLRALARQQHSQRQAVNDTGHINQLAAEQLAHAGAAGLAHGISASMGKLEDTLEQLRERFAKTPPPPKADLQRELAATETALGGGFNTLLGFMENGASGAEQTLADTATIANAGLAGITAKNDETTGEGEGGFRGQIVGLMAGATRTLGQIAGTHVQKAKNSATEGTAAMKAAVAGFDKALESIGGKIAEAIGKSLADLEKDLKSKMNELDGQIASEAWKAASKEQPAWKSVVAIILIIVVIIVATVISIVTLGAGASLFAVILIGALVGAVSAGLIQVINNWAAGEDLTKGLAQAMIMGAIGGAVGGALGFAGGALAAGAAAAGARVVTQLAITMTADLLAEGITQTIGYVAFGQEFNWQGFVMTGATSGLSFRPQGPRPRVPHGPTPHAPAPHTAVPHAEAPHVAAPHVEAPPAAAPRAGMPEPPTVPRAPTPEAPMARPGGPEGVAPHAVPPVPAAAGRRAAVTQVAGGALAGLGLEYITSKISGEQFDPTRAASAAASAAAAARASRRAHVAGPAPEPTTRIGRAAERLRTFDPGGVGARLEKRLEGLGGRMVGARPEAEPPAVARPPVTEQPPTPARAGEERVPLRPDEKPPEAATKPREEIPLSRPIAEHEPAPPRQPEEPKPFRPPEEATATPPKPIEETRLSRKGRSEYEPPDPGKLRETLGWSGTPTATPKPGEQHLALIQRGLDMVDRIQPGMRDKLAKLLPQIEDPLPAQRVRLEEVSAELQRIYSDRELSKLRALPREVVEKQIGPQAAARRDELMPRIEGLETEAARLHAEIESKRAGLQTEAVNELSALRKRLIGRNREAAEMAGRVRIEESAVKALEAKGRPVAAAQRDIAEYYGLTGKHGPTPESLHLMSAGGRAETTRAGRVDIGEEASRRTIFHELAHHLEFVDPSLTRAAKSFVEARATHAGRAGEIVPLQELQPKGRYEPHEQAMVGDFITPYTGKVYPDMMTEVVTTGLERFSTPEQMLSLYRNDPEHFFFTLGAILR